MENSGQFLFENDAPHWYVALNERWVGPMSASEIYEKIQLQQLSWAHFVWKKGQSSWKRICDVKTFQAAVPHEPAKGVQKEVKASVNPVVRQAATRKSGSPVPPPAPSKAPSEPRIWYLHYNETQFGPFTADEIKRYLKIGKIHLQVYGWRDGMKSWDRLGSLPEFQTQGTPPPKSTGGASRSAEQRNNPRRPLVAKILISDEQTVIVGVCRDISIGGLQVLTEKIPGKVGMKLKMNISPSTNEAGNRIESFVAEGVIVRILEDGRGFSFRFERLSDRARQAIESFIESPV
jgi:hypothetical protein